MTDNWTDTNANWTTSADWTNGTPTSSTDVAVTNAGGDPQVTAPISVRSIVDSAQIDFGNAGLCTVFSLLFNNGVINVDVFGSQGGTSLRTGRLTNAGRLSIGNANPSSATTFATSSLINTGTIQLTGGASVQTTMNVTGVAGFGTANVLTGTVQLAGDALLVFGSGQITSIAKGSLLGLSGASARIADANSRATSSALAGLTTIAGEFDLSQGATVRPTGASVTVSGSLLLDYYNGQGGSSATLGGGLINRGTVSIGNGGLSFDDSVRAASFNNIGSLVINGNADPTSNGGHPHQATLLLTGAAGFGRVGLLTGNVQLAGNALVQFATGQINTIGYGSKLVLGGAARIADASDTTTSSALQGLTTNSGEFDLSSGASASLTGSLDNTGRLQLDYYYGQGGSTLSVGARLSNSGTLQFGNGGLSSNETVTASAVTNTGSLTVVGNTDPTANAGHPPQATLSLSGSAGFGTGTTLTGNVQVAGNGLITFNSGQITSIAGGSTLGLNSATARIADASDTTTNSALRGLALVNGEFDLYNGATVVTTGDLNNTNRTNLDPYYGQGGSKLTVGSKLTNSGTVQVGNGGLSSNDMVSAAALGNTGTLVVTGNTDPTANAGHPAQATLAIASSAGFGTGATLTGNVQLAGNALIQFASGQVTSIGYGSTLGISTVSARIASGNGTTTNSALQGLALVSGELDLYSGAKIATTGNLNDTGRVVLDYYYGQGGSLLNIAGRLTNSGTLQLGNGGLSSNETVTAGSLANTGTLAITGNTDPTSFAGHPPLASLAVGGAAGFGIAGLLTGNVQLAGNAVLQFGSGQIDTIAANSTLSLTANGRIADTGALSSNSALVGLTENDGTFNLYSGASVAPTGNFDNAGSIVLDYFYGSGGSTLGVTGTLTNTGSIQIGNSGLSSIDGVTAGSLDNEGSISLTGGSTFQATVAVSGATTGSGTDSIGVGATLQFGGSVSAAQNVSFNGAGGTLALADAHDFLGTVQSFASGDTIDLTNFASATLAFVPNSGNTGGVLNVTGAASQSASIAFTGQYTTAQFHATSMGGQTLITV